MPVIPVFRRLRQEDCDFVNSLGSRVKASLKTKTKAANGKYLESLPVPILHVFPVSLNLMYTVAILWTAVRLRTYPALWLRFTVPLIA